MNPLRYLLPAAYCLLATLTAQAQASVAPSTVLQDERHALADRQAIPPEELADTYYLTYATTDPAADREDLKIATRLMVASTSRQVVLERCSPAPITGTLSRIHLGDLRWSREAWARALRNYPYAPHVDATKGQTPLVIRADWLLVTLADATQSSAYYDLLLGTTPAKRDDWLESLGVDRTAQPELRYGHIEEESGVAVNKIRWLESFPVLTPGGQGYAWGTRDTLEVSDQNDPLEHIDGDYQHDGEEWIVSLPKMSTQTRQAGVLQAYLLSDGQGNRVDAAPVALVEDATRFRGLAEIRNPGSCVQCHAEGLNKPNRNGLADYLLSGAELLTDGRKMDPRASREAIAAAEAFHLRQFDRQLDRANEDFGAIVETLCGVSASEAAAAFRRAVNRYDASLTLEDTALEMGMAPAMLRNAIAAQRLIPESVGARIAGLAHGRTIPREAFEARYHQLREIQDAWKD